MIKRIILCSDGTGDQGGSGRNTNVWRLYNLLEKKSPSNIQQLALYDDGVGTEKSTPKKLLGLGCGWGMSRNIRDLYTFLATHYTHYSDDPKDENYVYLFGFSRGAFTVRVLANLIDFAGIPIWNSKKDSPKDLENMVKIAVKEYKSWCKNNLGIAGITNKQYNPKTNERLTDRKNNISTGEYKFQVAKNVFIGVWDTVNSVGVPIDELRVIFPAWIQNTVVERLPQCVTCGFHALAIDDERKSFDPTLWNEEKLSPHQYVEQVWFPGMHANIGGGYQKDSLAHVSLEWMLERLERMDKLHTEVPKNAILQFNPSKKNISYKANANGKMYDSRSGLGAYYSYCPRNIDKITEDSVGSSKNNCPIIHEAVFNRIDNKTDFYAPTLFSKFVVAKNKSKNVDRPDKGKEFQNFEEYSVSFESAIKNTKKTRKKTSIVSKDEVKMDIQGRKNLYFLFICFSLMLLFLPKWELEVFKFDWAHSVLSTPASMVKDYLLPLVPGLLEPWIIWLFDRPIALIIVVIVFYALRFVKKKWEDRQLANNTDIWYNQNSNLIPAVLLGRINPNPAPKIRGCKGISNWEKLYRSEIPSRILKNTQSKIKKMCIYFLN